MSSINQHGIEAESDKIFTYFPHRDTFFLTNSVLGSKYFFIFLTHLKPWLCKIITSKAHTQATLDADNDHKAQ